MDDLMYALQQAIEARAAETKALEEYNGYEWGWHGREYTEATMEAENRFAAALNEVIDARIIAKLAELGLQTPSEQQEAAKC